MRQNQRMVWTSLTLIVLLSLETMSMAARARTATLVAQPATDWLSPFVGVWDTIDTYHPVNGAPIVERGRRTCEMVMQGTYLQCETVANRPSGGGRTYRFLMNHNRTMKRFEMLSPGLHLTSEWNQCIIH